MSSPSSVSSGPQNRPRWQWCLLLVLHGTLIGSGIGWTAVRIQQLEAEKEPPPFRDVPLHVAPLHDRPAVVSDEQLQTVLHKLRPQLRGRNPRINHVDHALRFWGIEAVFDDPRCLSGIEMRELLLDHRQFSAVWDDGAKPLLQQTLYGVRPRVQQGEATSSHVDHTAATLAEVGTPLDYPILTVDGETTYRAMLEHAVRDFSLNQIEYEWTAMVFALCCPTGRSWQTSEGQWINFDRLADRLMRQELTQGVCMGNHRLYSLVLLLRIDDQEPLLTGEGRQRILDHLSRVTETLVANQHEEGYWDRDWDGSDWDPSSSTQSPVARRILATGHALEWWAMAPEELLPPDEVLERAGQWLFREIDAMSETQIRTNYTFLSHAGRALALWRGRFPHEVYPAR